MAITKKLPVLPIERALKAISGRWKAVILYHLLGGPKRLSDLKRLLPQVSQKVLGNPCQSRFGITHCCRGVSIHGTKVTLTLD